MRATSVIAGYGTPVRSIRSISALRSSPVMVRVDCPGSLLGASSWRVTTPSISTCGRPPTVTITITRVVIGSK
jgi:hypothetical protein